MNVRDDCNTLFITETAWYQRIKEDILGEGCYALKIKGFTHLQLVDNTDGGMVWIGEPLEL